MYDRIRSAIVESRYAPGQRLIEQKIAEEFDLSRTPVREAIRRLEAEGLVVTERNRGAMVRTVAPNEVRDLYELRTRLESYAAELAAQRISPAELDELRDAVGCFHALVGGADDGGELIERIRPVNEANRRIHDAIVAAAHHARLTAMLARTVDIPLVFQAFRSFGRDELERSDLFHELILNAIAAGDGARAARLMAEHISQGLDAVVGSVDGSASPLDP